MTETPAPDAVRIVEQYRRVAGALDGLFRALSPRTREEAWRFDGLGSCDIDRATSEGGLRGPAAALLLRLRDERGTAVSGARFDDTAACPYHRIGQGCVLGDLKSPLCLSYIDNPRELAERFAMDAYRLSRWMQGVLAAVLEGAADDETVALACDAVAVVTRRVERHPLLDA